jgi:hypothetical protein
MRFLHRCRSSSHEPRPRPASTRALLVFVLGLAGASCGDANAPPGPVIEPPGVIPLTAIELTTYDGSGQVVHPDILANLGGSGGYWLAITPYPQGDAKHENPSFYQSGSGLTWTVPEGLLNPIAKPAAGHFSDPDLVRDPVSGELRIYFRQVAGGNNVILLTSTADGVNWTIPLEVARAASHRIVSPAVVAGAPAGAWQMWSVNAGSAGCSAAATTVERRRSADGVTWEPPELVNLAHPGAVIWHLDVRWVPERQQYWALYTIYAAGGSCVTPRLHLATSPDGVEWTPYAVPVLAKGALPEFRDVVYRSTFVYDGAAGLVRFWYSGAAFTAGQYVWRAALDARPADGLLESLASTTKHEDPVPLEPELDLPPPEPGDMP